MVEKIFPGMLVYGFMNGLEPLTFTLPVEQASPFLIAGGYSAAYWTAG
ncbi:hypothetical protein POHY109586_08110 [Polaromonas hydrogenivorans]